MYVATSGLDSGDCTDSSNPCRTVQFAVDAAASGDEVRVAGGMYTDIHTRPRQDITITGFVNQVVYLTKTLSIQGGYTLTNWTEPDPDAHPTILDAGGQGRVVYIAGEISPTLAGLHITGGDATGMGGLLLYMGDQDAGGGIYIDRAAAMISETLVSNNYSPEVGGGVYVGESLTTLRRNTIQDNRAEVQGGGGLFHNSRTLIVENDFYRNGGNSNVSGGGCYAWISHDTFISNTFSANIGDWGGGAYFMYSEITLTANSFISNTATEVGAGLGLDLSSASLTNNLFRGNIATRDAGGLFYLLATLIFPIMLLRIISRVMREVDCSCSLAALID
jgi:hypothetical protein